MEACKSRRPRSTRRRPHPHHHRATTIRRSTPGASRPRTRSGRSRPPSQQPRPPSQQPQPSPGASRPRTQIQARGRRIRPRRHRIRTPLAGNRRQPPLRAGGHRKREVGKKSRGPSRRRPCLPPICRSPALAATRQWRRNGRSLGWAERRRPSCPVEDDAGASVGRGVQSEQESPERKRQLLAGLSSAGRLHIFQLGCVRPFYQIDTRGQDENKMLTARGCHSCPVVENFD
ncbi:uncharacterized protein [Miscanthus floridulus]|uniref:uncharacterized protein n=1 Tax=Miscanthus floridulus TaxID=154761 RepID=UPI00345A2E63